MKRETRILVSACLQGVGCLAAIIRGYGVDSMRAGHDCSSLCESLAEGGFMGELRHAWGDCTCGLPPPANGRRLHERLARWKILLIGALEGLAGLDRANSS